MDFDQALLAWFESPGFLRLLQLLIGFHRKIALAVRAAAALPRR